MESREGYLWGTGGPGGGKRALPAARCQQDKWEAGEELSGVSTWGVGSPRSGRFTAGVDSPVGSQGRGCERGGRNSTRHFCEMC